MTPDGGSKRTVAECVSCGAGYAVQKWPDGTVQPIGTKNGCQCGSTEFRAIEKSEVTAVREEPNVDH